MSRIPKPYEIYKHFKGNLYQVLNVAEHSESGEILVIYQALYGEYKVYARELNNFTEILDKNKYPDAKQEYRFEPVSTEAIGAVETNSGMEPIAYHNVVNKEEVTHKEDMMIREEITDEETENEELHIDPMVMKFLDADTYEEKLQILVGLEHRITDEMITTMAIACDVEVPEGSTESRCQGLKNCLLTLDRFECNRLR